MDVHAFVDYWSKSTRSERSAAQEHFTQLCDLVGHPKPGESDASGRTFTFERRVRKEAGGHGFADAFKAGAFAWEYKTKGADLDDAFRQLLQYAGDLGNPPLMVASDMDRIEVRTRFNGYPTEVHKLDLKSLATPRGLDLLRRVFHDPESFRPEKTIARITEEAAAQLAEIAPGVRARHDDPTRVAHFLDRLIFCLFAEDVGLLPNDVFTNLVAKFASRRADKISKDIGDLFAAMATGGDFFGETIPHINGNLFNDASTLELTALELEEIHKAAAMDWSEMDPSIFGTLFERVMDPNQRSQLGAHYTGYADIATLVEPVVMAPLRREWTDCREAIESLAPAPVADSPADAPLFAPPDPAHLAEARARRDAFLARLRSVRVLDPACGSGNFLYVTLTLLKDLELDVLIASRRHGLGSFDLEVGPHQLLGIEVNPYAFDLAQMTVWIGMIQWHRAHGFPYDREPILQPLHTFEHKDAILDLSDPDNPTEPSWPDVEFIVGNPPFLGGKKMRTGGAKKENTGLGDDYVDRLFSYWRERVKPEADLCCYWFEKARAQIEQGRSRRAGLIGTQGIRGGANRETLKHIKRTGDIFFAESDRDWVLDGATVHVSMIAFDDGSDLDKSLDGQSVPAIHSNLSSATDVTQGRRSAANLDISFMGDTKGGSFEIIERIAIGMIDQPNPNGRPNSDVIVPWINGIDVTQRRRDIWIIDFEPKMPVQHAAAYASPFEYLKREVFPERNKNKRASYRERWWVHVEPRSAMRKALSSHLRFIVTPTVSKHRLFAWTTAPTLPDHQLIVFARSDDYFFGVLHSRPHEVWARSQGTQVRERESGFRYTPTTCFETFPFPEPTPEQVAAIAAAAKELDELRSNDLNPREWFREEVIEFPGSVDGPWSRFVRDPDERGIGTVRYPRRVPKDAHIFDVKKRTLTNLYNERPSWLDLAHRSLDEAVFAAYGWSPSMTDDELLAALLELNLERPPATPGKSSPAADEADD